MYVAAYTSADLQFYEVCFCFMCRGVLPSCVSMHHGHIVPVEARRRDGIISELELELTVSCVWVLGM